MRRFLQEAAWRFLLDEEIEQLPIYPSHIAKRHGWKLYTYAQIADRLHISTRDLIRKYDKDAFVFWSLADKTYVICYNSEMPPSVIRWSLMHEIAHIVLGHIGPDVPYLSRVRSEERSLWEVEAQGFARRVLCPSIVLHNCHTIEPPQIAQLCGISMEAAKHRSDYIKTLEARGKFRVHPLERAVEEQFKPFVCHYLLQYLNCEIAMEFVA